MGQRLAVGQQPTILARAAGAASRCGAGLVVARIAGRLPVVGPLGLVGAKANQVGLAGVRAQDVAHLVACKAQRRGLVVAVFTHEGGHEHHVACV